MPKLNEQMRDTIAMKNNMFIYNVLRTRQRRLDLTTKMLFVKIGTR
jgi:hypothetical protein